MGTFYIWVWRWTLRLVALIWALLKQLPPHSGLRWEDIQSWRDGPCSQRGAWARLHWWGTPSALCTCIMRTSCLFKPRVALLSLQGKMDRALALLQNADPADLIPDSSELLQLEGTNLNTAVNPVNVGGAVGFLTVDIWAGACEQMNPLIDEKLQEIDRCVTEWSHRHVLIVRTVELLLSWLSWKKENCKWIQSANDFNFMFQETLWAIRVKRQSSGGFGVIQQADEWGSLLHSLLKNADAVRTSRLSCSHAGEKLLSFVFDNYFISHISICSTLLRFSRGYCVINHPLMKPHYMPHYCLFRATLGRLALPSCLQ